MTLAVLCSGQGRQDRSMFDMLADAPAAATILAQASKFLGTDIRGLLRDASDDQISANRTSQILCVTRGLAAAAAILPASTALVAGYSVGEMTAWGITGFWSPEQTLELVAKRAELMDAASGPNDRLAFVRGLPRSNVEDLVARHDCAISIVNPNQVFVIGGSEADVQRCCAAALALGAASARTIAVHVASHTPKLSRAVAPFLNVLTAAPLARPRPDRTLIGAANATIVRGAHGLEGLAAQIEQTIDWSATLEALFERGTDRVLELGPGSALAEMVRSARPNMEVRAVDDFRTLDGVVRWIAD